MGSRANDRNTHMAIEDEELYGVWINTEYNNNTYHAKEIYSSDGIVLGFDKEYNSIASWKGNFIIIDKWSDSGGNIWYKITLSCTGLCIYYQLIKINNISKTLEIAYFSAIYPTEESLSDVYSPTRIYYRQ